MSNPTEKNDLVAELLGEDGPNMEPRVVQLDAGVASEVRSALNNSREKDTPATKIETPIPAVWQETVKAPADLISWVFESQRLGNVEVTDAEKLLYWKGFIHDTDVIFDIPMFGMEDVAIRIRGLNIHDQDLISQAVRADQDQARAIGLEDSITAMQRYAVMLQVIGIDGQEFPRFDSSAVYPAGQRVKALQSATDTALGKMNPAKLLLLCRAILVYEVKIKLCNDAVVNRRDSRSGFWKAPDTV